MTNLSVDGNFEIGQAQRAGHAARIQLDGNGFGNVQADAGNFEQIKGRGLAAAERTEGARFGKGGRGLAAISQRELVEEVLAIGLRGGADRGAVSRQIERQLVGIDGELVLVAKDAVKMIGFSANHLHCEIFLTGGMTEVGLDADLDSVIEGDGRGVLRHGKGNQQQGGEAFHGFIMPPRSRMHAGCQM
jgi:hypothetical protein